MRMLLTDPPPVEFEALLERRRQMGADRRDEVWDGVYVMMPSPHRRHARLQAQLLELLGPLARAGGLETFGEFNLGAADDYRVPDAALAHPGPDELYNATAALAVEIVSPGDMTWEKLDFYAAHGVDELLIGDPLERKIDWLGLATDGRYEPVELSRLIDLGPQQLHAAIDWPPVEP